MGYVRDVKQDIYSALSDYDCNVVYTKGNSDCCGYFTIYIDDEYDYDDVADALDDVCDDYNLYIDDESDGVLDLNENG